MFNLNIISLLRTKQIFTQINKMTKCYFYLLNVISNRCAISRFIVNVNALKIVLFSIASQLYAIIFDIFFTWLWHKLLPHYGKLYKFKWISFPLIHHETVTKQLLNGKERNRNRIENIKLKMLHILGTRWSKFY